MTRCILAFLLTFFVALPLRAGEYVVEARILPGWRMADGTHMAGLLLTLRDGWKTYWRAPGDAGIPPQFDWRGARNIGAVRIDWPTPEVFDQSGMRSIGYAHQVVLPITVTPDDADRPVRLRGVMDIGVCKDVCIPSSLSFDAALDPQAGRHPAIAAALAARPFSETEAGVVSAKCVVAPHGNGLRLEAHIRMPSAGAQEHAVFEPLDPRIWSSEATTARRGDTLVTQTDLEHVSGGAFALDRSTLRITVLGSDHAVDIHGCQPG